MIRESVLKSKQPFFSRFPLLRTFPCPVPPCKLQPAVFMMCYEPPHAPLLLPLRLAGAAVRVGVIAILAPWGFTSVPTDVLARVR